MPTGYTDVVGKGEITDFTKFALRCTRAMGVSIMQRDESIDVPLRVRETVSEYERNNLTEAKAEYLEVAGWSLEQWAAEQRREHDEWVRGEEESLAKQADTIANYRRMLVEVLAWQPPTEEHEGLKKFMVEQLEESIKFDSWKSSGVREMTDPVLYRDERIARKAQAVRDAAKSLRDAEARVASRNKWVDDLLASLPNKAALPVAGGDD